MSIFAVVLAVVAAAAFVLRCTVLAPATGRHVLSRSHPGWEDRTSELRALILHPGKHERPANSCGDRNPWDNSITCNLPVQHRGDRHERRLPNGDIQAWTDRCHFPGDDCGPDAHSPNAA